MLSAECILIDWSSSFLPWNGIGYSGQRCRIPLSSPLSFSLKGRKQPSQSCEPCHVQWAGNTDAVLRFMTWSERSYTWPSCTACIWRSQWAAQMRSTASAACDWFKNYLWACIKDTRPSTLTLLSTERDRVAHRFAHMRDDRMELWNELDACVLNTELRNLFFSLQQLC